MKKELGEKWLKALYVIFGLQVVFGVINIFSLMGQVKMLAEMYRFNYYVEKMRLLFHAAEILTVVQLIVKIYAIATKKKASGYPAIFASFAVDIAVGCFNMFVISGIGGIFIALVAYSALYAPSVVYIRNRKHWYLADKNHPVYQCEKCGYGSNEAGKCPTCDIALKKF